MQRPNAPSATKALVFGILGLFCCQPLGIFAIIYGNKTKREVAGSGGSYDGSGMGTAGVVLGWIAVIFMVLGAIGSIIAAIMGATIGPIDFGS